MSWVNSSTLGSPTAAAAADADSAGGPAAAEACDCSLPADDDEAGGPAAAEACDCSLPADAPARVVRLRLDDAAAAPADGSAGGLLPTAAAAEGCDGSGFFKKTYPFLYSINKF